jgi:glycosyltransferase involved in cell wall biosynthesis
VNPHRKRRTLASDCHRKVLFVSYWHPPLPEVGGFRIARFCGYLPEFGVEPFVVCAKATSGSDDSFELRKEVHIRRVSGRRHPLDIYRQLKEQLLPAGSLKDSPGRVEQDSNHGPNLFLQHLFATLQFPDLYWTWRGPALRAAREVLQREGVTQVISSGPPWTAHLVARALKREFHVDWVADFRDPWLEDYSDWLPSWYKSLARRSENACVHEADRILCNTDRLRELFLRKFPTLSTDKFVTLTNGFDTDVHTIGQRDWGSRKVILHLGSLYAKRNIDGLCEALLLLLNAGKVDPSRQVVQFFGNNDLNYVRSAKERFPSLFSTGLVEIRSRISFGEAQERMWNSDVLLVLQGDHPLCVPAKFYECASTGIPLLAITRTGALTDIIRDTGAGESAEPDIPADIAEKLMLALSRSRTEDTSTNPRLAKYHYRNLTRNLSEVLDGIRR